MNQQILLENAFAQQDRLELEVLSKKDCVVTILKVARADATTSLIKQAIESHMKVVIFEPTHEIGNDTVSGSAQLCNNTNAKILQFLKNSEACKKLIIECEKNPLKKKMKWLLRPEKCENCSYFNDPSCELQRILNCSNWDVLVVTYQKLKALWLSKDFSQVSQMQLQKIKSADVAIFDEYTAGLLGLTPSVELSEKKCSSLASIALDDIDQWWTFTLQVAIASQEFGNQLKQGQSCKFENPLTDEELEKLKTNFTAEWNRAKRLTANGVETEYLQDMLQMAWCKELFTHKDRKSRVTLIPLEQLEKELSFINGFADEFTTQGKLSILVDAQMPEFDLQPYFESKVEPFLWGDPNNTNDKTVYFCDSRKIGEADVHHEKARSYLIECINRICDFHKDAGRLLIVCVNKSVANEVERWQKQGLIPNVEVTWYRSDKTRGVQAKGNVEIMIGGPYIPLASYLHKVAKEAESDPAGADSWNRIFRKTNIDAEFVNSSTRVKDPKGVYQSYIYCLGVTKIEVMRFLNLYGQLYASGKVKRPDIIGLTKTDMTPNEWVDMTNLYQRKNEIADPENHLPYILELHKLWLINKDKENADFIPLQMIFRAKSKEAQQAVLLNKDFLDSIGIHIEKKGRGFRLKLNDKNPY